MNIILAGMPGCGKTTVSKLLANKLGFEVVDTDELIVKEHGEISKIFAGFGEEYFRKLECEVVEKVASLRHIVVSTGGGCLINPKNVEAFKRNGKIVYLKTGIKELARRLEGDTTRPLLKGDAEANLKNLYERRASIYESAADFTVQTDGLTPDRIAEKITEHLK